MKRGWVRTAAVLAVILMSVSAVYAAPLVRIDMDANTPGYQNSILVNSGASFTTDIQVLFNNSSDSLSSFGFSLWWDTNELNTPLAQNITTLQVMNGWSDLSYMSVQPPYIKNFAQIGFDNPAEGPLSSVVARIMWTASNVATNNVVDIMPGNYTMFDEAFDKNGDPVSIAFAGGKVNLAPEPISSILFVAGGMLLAGKRYLRKNQ